MRRGFRRKCPKQQFALVFWPDCVEVTTVPVSDLKQIIKGDKVRKGWRGDLPWVDAYGITEIYEASIIKLSYNKDQLDSILLDCWGFVVKRSVPLAVEEEMRNITKKKVQKKSSKAAAQKDMQDEVLQCANLFQDEGEDENIHTEENFDQSQNAQLEDVSKTPATKKQSKDEEFAQQILSIVTPENIGFLDRLLLILRTRMQQEPLVQNPEVRVNLHKGITLLQSEIDLAKSKARYQKFAFMWELFQLLVPKSEIKKDSTATCFPLVRDAIIAYVNSMPFKKKVLETQYNSIITSRLRVVRMHLHGTPEQIEHYYETRKTASKNRRQKTKSEDKDKREGDKNHKKKRKMIHVGTVHEEDSGHGDENAAEDNVKDTVSVDVGMGEDKEIGFEEPIGGNYVDLQNVPVDSRKRKSPSPVQEAKQHKKNKVSQASASYDKLQTKEDSTQNTPNDVVSLLTSLPKELRLEYYEHMGTKIKHQEKYGGKAVSATTPMFFESLHEVFSNGLHVPNRSTNV